MKKLLCVLMFGFVLSQDVIGTREYTIEINSDTESIDILGLIGETEGVYSIEFVQYQTVNFPENDWCIMKYHNIENEDFFSNDYYLEMIIIVASRGQNDNYFRQHNNYSGQIIIILASQGARR